MMLATMFVSLGTATAATTNTTIGAVPNVSTTGTIVGAKLRIDEAVLGNFAAGNTISLTLPSGTSWTALPTVTALMTPGATGAWAAGTSFTFTPVAVSTRVVNVTITGACTNVAPTAIDITMPITVTSLGTGALNVNVVAPGTAITAGDYAVAAFTTAGAVVSVLSTPTTGGSANYGIIRIIENSIGAVTLGQTITLKLPGGYTWGASTISPSNNTTFGAVVGAGTQILTYTCTATGTAQGIFDITTPIVASSSAAKGDVIVTVGGTANIATDVTIGSYADYGVTVTADTAKEVISAIDQQKIAVVTVKEGIAGSLVPSRTITFTLPANTRFNTAPTLSLVSGGGAGWAGILTALSSTDTVATATLPTTVSTTAAKFELKNVYIDVAANVTGDINMVVGGTASATGNVVVATALPIVTLSADVKDVIIGVQSQPAGDITITEGKKGALLGANSTITLTAPSGVTFGSTPSATVTAGNMTIKSVTKVGAVVTITVDASSTTASALKVSGITLTADRSVPEGAVKISVAGTAIMQGAAFVGVTSAGSVQNATVVTPASNVVSYTSTFVLGSSTYTLNGVTVDAIAASYAKNNRTYLSIRDVAHVLGISDSNILWDQNASTVTLIKGDKVVQLKNGSNVILINGASITMDVSVEASNNRTFLPAAWVAQAFGASATYDAATQTVTIK
jgi:hypothetical protein